VITILGTTVLALRKSESDLILAISFLMANYKRILENSGKTAQDQIRDLRTWKRRRIKNSSLGEKASPYRVRIVVSKKESICSG